MANYFIIGSDGKQYGPISADDLRQWIAESRVNARTQAQAEGATTWHPLSEFSEFSGAFGGSAPPPLPPATPAVTTAKTSGMAITSLVLGILSIATCGFTWILSAPIGLILGIVAMNKIGKSQGQLKGKGLALTGVITSGVSFLMIPVLIAMFLPALAAAKQKAMTIVCINNEKQLALAVKQYEYENNEHFPPAATWCDAIRQYAVSDSFFKCLGANPSSRCDYGFNVKLDGLDDSKADPSTPRHAHMFVVALVDGTVEQVSESELNTLRWDP